LGGEVCGLLVEHGHEVTGLINRNPEILRNDGSPVSAARTIGGDVTEPGLGLPPGTNFDMIVHCAAVTAFTEETPAHRRVNVLGTEHVTALAQTLGAGLVHVSTAYVAGQREGVILEGEFDEGQRFSNGYESTKFEAERIVRESEGDWVIIRPGIVLGDYGEGRSRSFETIYPILKVFAEARITRMPALPNATLDLVPIDYVCRGIVETVERFAEARGRAFHLVSSSPTPLSAFPETLARFEGLSSPLFVHPSEFDPATLPPMQRRFFERGAAVYASYFTRSPLFDDTEWRSFSGTSCLPVGEGWWERLVQYALDARFIRPAKKAAP
jgi:nucleoside-diphosphate-sugar epimerase